MLTASEAADDGLLIEALNSAPVIDGTVSDALAEERTGRAWLHSHGLSDSATEWRSFREARDLLWSVIRDGSSAETLQGVVAGSSSVPSATATGIHWELQPPRGRSAAVRLVLAWDRTATGLPGRLRPCANPDCRLFLLDRSKNNTGRWCSMAVCGNRMKARRHYSRSNTAQD